jgi:hypothetical protein
LGVDRGRSPRLDTGALQEGATLDLGSLRVTGGASFVEVNTDIGSQSLSVRLSNSGFALSYDASLTPQLSVLIETKSCSRRVTRDQPT